MNTSLRHQTITFAVLYALKSNKDIYVKVIGRENFQPYVVGANETISSILEEGYSNQSLLYKGSYFCIDKTTENDWRALNVYYAVKLNLKTYNVLDSSLSPIIKTTDSALNQLACDIANFSPIELEKIYRSIVKKILSNKASPNDIKNVTVKINIDMYRKILLETNSRLDKKYSTELSSIRKAAKTIDELMFKKYTDEKKWLEENRARLEEEAAIRYFEEDKRKKEKEAEEEKKRQDKKIAEENRRLNALEKERNARKKKLIAKAKKFKKYNGDFPFWYNGLLDGTVSIDSIEQYEEKKKNEENQFSAFL